MGNIKEDLLKDLVEKVRDQYPCHRVENYDGNCPYRDL